MPFIMFKGERKVTDLLERAYGADLKAADQKRAEAALVKANPQLAKLREIKPGTMIRVPDLPGLARPPQREMPEASLVELQMERDAVDEYRKRLGARLDDERRLLDADAELLKSADARTLARIAPESAPYFDRVAEANKRRLAELQDRAGFVKTLAKARADFDALTKKLG